MGGYIARSDERVNGIGDDWDSMIEISDEIGSRR